MDTKLLLSEAKARFSHNSAKAYLKDKYDSKLIVAEQGGLWKADMQTINFLAAMPNKELIIMDTFDNPVKVDRTTLLNSLTKVYNDAMEEWHTEWKELENKR